MRRTRIIRLAAVALALAIAAPAAQAITGPTKSPVLDPNMAGPLASGGEIPVVAQFRTPPTADDARALRAAGVSGALIRYKVVPAVSFVASAASIRTIAKSDRVTYIEHDATIPYLLERSTRVTRTDEVWSSEYATAANPTPVPGNFTGKGIGVAINDSGVDARHQDLLYKPLADATAQPAKTVVNKKIVGRTSIFPVEDFIDAGGLAVDQVNSDTTGGHGTHVAGIAAGNGANSGGKYKGHAPGADIIGLGAGDTLFVTFGLASFDWIHENYQAYNIRVVNNSWGGAGAYRPESALTKAVQKLVNEDGIVVVFAAGNDGGDGTTLNTNLWANIPEVISVANYFDRTGWVDSSSSRGLASDETTWPDFAAPGTQIISTAAAGGPVTYVGSGQDALIEKIDPHGDPLVVPAPTPTPISRKVGDDEVIVGDYASFTGTSMAAPAVAGIVAVMLEANPALNPAQVKEILRETANMPGAATYASEGFAIGKGVVDTAEAVAVALRMKEGQTLAQALGSASLDLSATPTQINVGSGPVTDNDIPLTPAPKVLSGTPLIFQAGLINPFLTSKPTIFPGEPVTLTVRNIASNDATQAPLTAGGFTVVHRITRGGVDVVPPMATVISPGWESDSSWTVPANMPMGDYVFESQLTITATNATFPLAYRTFSVGVAAG